MAAYVVLYIRRVGAASWSMAFMVAIPLLIGMYLLFNTLLHVPWPPSLVGDEFPQLRALLGGLV
jgi:hypothetical protein